jgi:hypothetical protein
VKSVSSSRLFGFLALLACACGPGRVPQNGPPPDAPTTEVIARGDGDSSGGHLGPKGGRIELGPGPGPGFEIPEGTAGAGGISISIEKAPDAGLPSAAAIIGPAFRSTVALAPPSGKWIGVFSAPQSEVPPACTGATLKVALEAPPAAGPADGAGSPALVWTYVDATWEDKVARAELPKLEPVRTLFLCTAAQ